MIYQIESKIWCNQCYESIWSSLQFMRNSCRGHYWPTCWEALETILKVLRAFIEAHSKYIDQRQTAAIHATYLHALDGCSLSKFVKFLVKAFPNLLKYFESISKHFFFSLLLSKTLRELRAEISWKSLEETVSPKTFHAPVYPPKLQNSESVTISTTMRGWIIHQNANICW